MYMSVAKAVQSPQLISIDAAYEGQRIDNFLLTRLKGVPKSHIYKVLRKGEVRVNKGRIKPEYRLRPGDMVRIPPIQVSETPPKPSAGGRIVELIAKSVIYEDKGLIIINKPSGIAVHGGSGVSYGVIEALRVARPDAPHLELVHRLDRDTSGCLMIAKKRSVLRSLHELLRGEKGIDKRYLALVKGKWRGGKKMVDAALARNQIRSGERVVRVTEEGKSSASVFVPHTVFVEASLMEVRPLTGRTHQIRVHAAWLEHPVAGDEKYGDAEFNRRMTGLGLKRLFLHAWRLEFELPETGQKISVSAPLSDDLQQVIARLSGTRGEAAS